MACSGMTPSPFFPPNFFLQMQTPNEEEEHLSNPLLTSNTCTNHQDFSGAGLETMLGKRFMYFSGMEPCDEMNGGGEVDLSDDCSQAGEKKRRLSTEQVKTLEKSFELRNRLAPEKKLQLAKALGLQPRQVAIWFQNRRARWKTKQLEKDYQALNKQFEVAKAKNDVLQSQNKRLQAEIMGLRGREASELINLNKETEGSCSNRSDNSSEINLDISRTSATESPLHPHQSLPFFQSLKPPAPNMTQLLLPSTRSEIKCPRMEHGVPDEYFSNLLCAMEDQAAFWPWSDQHDFH